MVLGGIGRVLGKAGELASEDDLVSDPRRGATFGGDLALDSVLSGESADLRQRSRWRLGAEDHDLRGEPQIWQMISEGVGNREGCLVGRKQRGDPEADEGDVGLHV